MAKKDQKVFCLDFSVSGSKIVTYLNTSGNRAMNRLPLSALIVLLLFVGLSCRLIERISGGDEGLSRAAELWSDVPRMDALEPSEMEMPFAIKVVMRTVLNNLWRLNDKNEDKTPVSGDWIVFTTGKTPADVQAFYTNARMTSFGSWDAVKESKCIEGKESGLDGVLCAFQKISSGKEIMLAVIAVKDDSTKQTNVFFLRLEQDAQPGAANTSNVATSAKKSRPDSITPLGHAAPYGIEQRPMPSGLDLETLLPKAVGSFERTLVERSGKRGVPTTTIERDSESVYATYRDGEKEVFVELGVNTDAKNAQDSLEVAAGDAAGGIPDDPKLGSIGTEPSYVKSGAFIAWTRRGYFFSADAKGGEADLDAFMKAFPY